MVVINETVKARWNELAPRIIKDGPLGLDFNTEYDDLAGADFIEGYQFLADPDRPDERIVVFFVKGHQDIVVSPYTAEFEEALQRLISQEAATLALNLGHSVFASNFDSAADLDEWKVYDLSQIFDTDAPMSGQAMLDDCMNRIAEATLLYIAYEIDENEGTETQDNICANEDDYAQHAGAILGVPGMRTIFLGAIHDLLFDDHFSLIGESVALRISDEQKAALATICRDLSK